MIPMEGGNSRSKKTHGFRWTGVWNSYERGMGLLGYTRMDDLQRFLNSWPRKRGSRDSQGFYRDGWSAQIPPFPKPRKRSASAQSSTPTFRGADAHPRPGKPNPCATDALDDIGWYWMMLTYVDMIKNIKKHMVVSQNRATLRSCSWALTLEL